MRDEVKVNAIENRSFPSDQPVCKESSLCEVFEGWGEGVKCTYL